MARLARAIWIVALFGVWTCALPKKEVVECDIGDALSGLGCEVCAAEKCCAEASACADDPSCSARLACNDVGCVDNTFDQKLHDLEVCVFRLCDRCDPKGAATICPGAATSSKILGPASCAQCLAAKCCAQATDYQNDPILGRHAACIVDDARCSTANVHPGCYDNCRGSEYASNDQALQTEERETDFLECAVAACFDACRVGRMLECAGNYRWPPSATDLIGIQFRLVGVVTPHPGIEGVDVYGCTQQNAMCAVTAPPTDALGLTTLELAISNANASGTQIFYRFDAPPPEYDVWYYQNTRQEYRDRARDRIPIPSEALIDVGRMAFAKEMITIDESLGIAAGAMLDCRGWPITGMFARDIEVEISDPNAVVVYVDELTTGPDFTQELTDGSGAFFIVNIEDDAPKITLSLHGEEVGRASLPAVGAGARTILGVAPMTAGQ